MPIIPKPNQHFDVFTYNGGGPPLTRAGNAQMSTAQKKYGDSSLLLDGSGDYLTLDGSSGFAFETGDFTIEMWVYLTSLPGGSISTTFYDARPVGGVTGYSTIWMSSDKKFQYYTNGATQILGTTVVSANTWYHVAVSRSGTSTRLFVNGVQEGATFSDSTNYLVGASRPAIGTNLNLNLSYVTGYIDDLRVYKGVAKYTANFTPPTAAIGLGSSDPNWQYCTLAMPMDGPNASGNIPASAYSATTQSSLAFKPDLFIIKNRSLAAAAVVQDAVRGFGYGAPYLVTDSNAAENTTFPGYGVHEVSSTGFVLAGNGSLANLSPNTYVAWCWKAGESAVTNTDGSVTSTVDVNANAGFSIATFTAPASGAFTVGHGLGVAPQFVIVKGRGPSASSWNTFHASVCTTTSQYLVLQATQALASVAGVWGSALPTSSVVGMTAATTVPASQGVVMYSWAPVAGYSGFGVYTGNGSGNGPFVNLGFRPALVIIKMSSSTGNWMVFDDHREGYNPDNDVLILNSNAVEPATDYIDLLSNGFKIRTTDASVNTNAGKYVYAAWAESPFKYALAR